MAGVLTPTPKTQFFDNAGAPLAGGKLHTFEAGTSTPKATYTTQAATVANANPVILDASGRADIWLLGPGSYKFRLDDADDVTLWTVDNIPSTESSTVLASTNAALPAAGTAGRLRYVTDNIRGFRHDTGNEWLWTKGRIDAREFRDSGLSDTQALQLAIDTAEANNIPGVWLGDLNETWDIDTTLDLDAISWFGGGATLRWTGAANGRMINCQDASGIVFERGHRARLVLNGQGIADYGIYAAGGPALSFQNAFIGVTFIDFVVTGLMAVPISPDPANDAADMTLIDTDFSNCGVGLHIGEPSHRIFGGFITECTVGVIVNANANIAFFGTVWSSNEKHIQAGVGAIGIHCYQNWFEGNDNANGHILWVPNASTFIYGGVSFDGCTFQPHNTDATAADGVGYFLDLNNWTAAGGSLQIRGGGFAGNNVRGKTIRVPSGLPVYITDFDETQGSTITFTGTLNRLFYRPIRSATALLLGHGTLTGANNGDVVMYNAGAYRFVSNTSGSSVEYGILSATTDDLNIHVPGTGDKVALHWAGTEQIRFVQENAGPGIFLIGESSSDHGQAPANSVVLFLTDNGSGKTQLKARFGTGSSVVIATEP